MDVAYMGFTQDAGIRCFRFERIIEAQRQLGNPRRTVQFMISADMALFLRHGVPIQEGPAICRGVLAEATAGTSEKDLVPASYFVAEAHLASFAAAKVAIAQAKVARRGRSFRPRQT